MSSDFVRYTPEIETIDPDIEELMAQIIEFWEKKVRESPTRPRAPGGPSAARMRSRSASSGQRSSSCSTCLRRTRRASMPSRVATAP